MPDTPGSGFCYHSNTPERTSDGQERRSVPRAVLLRHGAVYQLYARTVGQGELHGFVDVEDLVFDDRSELVIDLGGAPQGRVRGCRRDPRAAACGDPYRPGREAGQREDTRHRCAGQQCHPLPVSGAG
ncbi:MAG: DUF1820 family protein [Desulfosudis oleivorans]|nr:DUF1820 family protein [Desulfosudis oleivorans]